MMNADTIRQLFEYNYSTHRRVWDCMEHITDAQFVEEVPYSLGSIRNHIVHLMTVDSRWLGRLQAAPLTERLDPADFPTRAAARQKWDTVEAAMLAYAAGLRDDQLFESVEFDMPHRGGLKRHLRWEILSHIVNHGTEHRAQILPILHRLGAPTFEQDFMIYLWGKG